MCRVLSQLARPLRLEPECLEVYAASLKLVCREQRVNSPVLAKAVVSLYVQVSDACAFRSAIYVYKSVPDSPRGRAGYAVVNRDQSLRAGRYAGFVVLYCMYPREERGCCGHDI